MVVLTIKLLIQLLSLWRLKKGGTTYNTDEGLRLVESDKITAPFSFFHWIFYNPTQHSDDEWQQIWAHECVHAQQHHSIDMLAAEVLKIVFWFNPFAWWHQRLVQETLEFITDRAVLDSGVEKKSYQYHLLRSTLSADNEAFTNHFNKSLLKNRIAMMNKAKSSWKALGKYGVFIGMLWVCAAFTKPYRAEVAAKIVEKVPDLEVVLQPKVNEKPALNDFVWVNESSSEENNMTPIAAKNQDTLVSETKYVTYSGKKLYWLITPKVSLKDLADIQREFQKVGCIFFVKQMKFDPLGYFLLDAGVKIASLSGKGKCENTGTMETGKPIQTFGGYIQIGDGSCGISTSISETALLDVAKQDQNEVEDWINTHRYEYLKLEYQQRKKDSNKKVGFSEFKTDGLQYLCQTGARNQIYFKADGYLQIESFYRKAEFVVDNKLSTIDQVEQLSIKDLYSVLCYAWYDDSQVVKRSFAIFTNVTPILP
jgi:hypothetical protein